MPCRSDNLNSNSGTHGGGRKGAPESCPWTFAHPALSAQWPFLSASCLILLTFKCGPHATASHKSGTPHSVSPTKLGLLVVKVAHQTSLWPMAPYTGLTESKHKHRNTSLHMHTGSPSQAGSHTKDPNTQILCNSLTGSSFP